MLPNAIQTLVFYLLAAISLTLAWSVVTGRRILRAAVALMGVLAASAGLYVLLDSPFLAGVQVLVYVGGIVVLLVFAVMLTRTTELLEDTPKRSRQLLGGTVATAFFLLSCHAMTAESLSGRLLSPLPKNDVAAIGRAFLDTGANGYTLPFEVVSLLLLTAMIGGIVIARKPAALAKPEASQTMKTEASNG